MPTSLGVNFGVNFSGGPETLEKQRQQICYQNLSSNFGEKFAGNLPQIHQAKIKKSPEIRSAEPRAQHLCREFIT